MTSPNEKTTEIKAAFEELPKFLKFTGTIGSICGFLYLFTYTRDVGIPFPLELSVLPTVLLLVGITSLAGTAIVLGGVVVPAIVADNSFSATHKYFSASDVIVGRVGVRLRRYFRCIWIPMVTALIGLLLPMGLIEDSAWTTPVGFLLVAFSAVWIIATPGYVEEFKNMRVTYIMTIAVQTLLSVFAYFLTVVLVVAFYPEVEKSPAWQACLLLLLIFTLIHATVMIPHDSGKVIVLPPTFDIKARPTHATALTLVAFLTGISVMMYPINARIGRAVLSAFNAGGGRPIIICLKEAPPTEVAKRMAFNTDKCSSEPLMSLFDAGDLLYVAKHPPKQDGSSPRREQAFEPIQFRPDEIRQKIYPLTPVSRKKD